MRSSDTEFNYNNSLTTTTTTTTTVSYCSVGRRSNCRGSWIRRTSTLVAVDRSRRHVIIEQRHNTERCRRRQHQTRKHQKLDHLRAQIATLCTDDNAVNTGFADHDIFLS